MKHVALGLLSLALYGLAGYVVWSNVHALTTSLLAFAGGLIAFASLLSFYTDTTQAFAAIAPYLPFRKHDQ